MGKWGSKDLKGTYQTRDHYMKLGHAAFSESRIMFTLDPVRGKISPEGEPIS